MSKIRSKPRPEVVNAIAELDRLGYKYEAVGDDEIRFCCPVHEDSSPSAGLNTETNLWRCRTSGCGAKGDVISLITHILNKNGSQKFDRGLVAEELSERYPDLFDVKTLNPETIERYHSRIWDAGPLLKELRKRGITDDQIRHARLGLNRGRITIPVRDASQRFINMRSYLPGAPGPEKFRNMRSYGKLSLYQIEDVRDNDIVWICGGEMKALGIRGRMAGVGSCAVTGGEGVWDHELTKEFKGKTVYICMDIDTGGRIASRQIARYLFHAADTVKIITLPLDREKFPKGDLSNFIGDMAATDEQLLDLMVQAEEFVPEDAEDIPMETRRVLLSEASRSENVHYGIDVTGVVSALHETPFVIPKTVTAVCDRNQKNCSSCPIFPMEPDDNSRVQLTISGTSPAILEMVASGKKAQGPALREALRVPPCKSVAFAVQEYRNALDVRLSPELSVQKDNGEYVVQPAIIVGHRVDLNTPYRMLGRVYPNPKNQEAVLVINEIEQAEDTLRSFEPDKAVLEELSRFQPEEWTAKSIGEKLNEIYSDFEYNVTKIYKRREIHSVIDLTYHSVLNFEFDGRIHNGWVNSLIVGDSAQGKSETSIRLMEHYGLGDRVECKNSSVAGLIGGVQQLGNRWFITWGVIPFHDRRMLFLEEVKGTSTEVIGKLTDMRSSGIAEISKIEKRKAHARTRLCMISNPRSDRPVSSYNFGVDVIPELIGGLEDVRRFDIATIVSSGQVSAEEISRLTSDRDAVEHTYSGDLCRQLILWAWTRSGEQVRFTDDAVKSCVSSADRLTQTYSDALPLVDRGTTRIKVARLAAALAARTFSHDDYDEILVRECHVEYVLQLLSRLYDDPAFGYRDFSAAQKYATTVLSPDEVENRIRATQYPRDFVENLLHRNEITVIDIQDWCELPREDASSLLSFLVRKHALTREKRWYLKTSEFIELLKQMKNQGLPDVADALKEGAF